MVKHCIGHKHQRCDECGEYFLGYFFFWSSLIKNISGTPDKTMCNNCAILYADKKRVKEFINGYNRTH